jgi:hypothetical protein
MQVETASRSPRPGAAVFVLVVVIGVGIFGGLYVVSAEKTATQSGSPSPAGYGSDQVNGTMTTTATGAQPNPVSGQSPLPTQLLGAVPQISMDYDNMPFSGAQGGYCWSGGAVTNQSTTDARRACVDVTEPSGLAGVPTIAVYPNASVSFNIADQQYPNHFSATLYQAPSMKLINSDDSVTGSFALGSLTPGDYLLRVNASYGGSASYTSNYFGIQQIESVNFSEGSVRISIGSPSVEMQSLSQNGSGTMTVGFPGLEVWPLTLSSVNVVRDVNLSSISVISGDWVKFVPSYVQEVGPNGTGVDMLLAGAVRPFVNNDISNVSMIIEAQASGGVAGEVALPLEGSGSAIVIHSLQLPGQEFSVPAWSIMSANQSNFGIYSLIYDPANAQGNQSLPVSISIAGFLNDGGQIVPQPAWLQFSVPKSSMGMSIAPDQPLYFSLSDTSTSAAPLGYYTLVVDFTIGGQTVTVFTPFVVEPPMSAGGSSVSAG